MVVPNQLPASFQNGSDDLQIDHLLDDAIRSVNEWSQSWDPSCNGFEDEEGFAVQMALSGMEADQIDVHVENDVLRVRGERKRDASECKTWYARDIGEGIFSCSFQIPARVDREQGTASYKQGLLTITFPKRKEAKPRMITIDCQ
jgi:HSP20 family protein